MELNKLRNFAKELIEAVSIGSVAKLKIIIANYVKVLENSNDEITSLKVRENDNGGINNLNDAEKSCNEIRYLKVLVNCEDKHGWTPLQIAANLGFDEICKLLIHNGANIDIERENSTSPLMLAASNNHGNVVSVLLEHDETVSRSDSVYAAADRAGFRGHIEVKNLIYGHMVKRALDRFIKTHESELCVNLRNPLYELLMQENKHPVRLMLYLKETLIIQQNLSACIDILNELCEQQIEEGKNEQLSWVCHNIAYTFAKAEEFLYCQPKTYADSSSASDENVLDSLIKSWIKDQPINNYSQALLDHLQEATSAFPFKDSNVYENMSLLPVESYCQEFTPFETCETCRNRHGLKWCSRCQNIKYCGQTCQKLHWFVHKIDCKTSSLSIQEMAKALETKLSLNN